METRWLQKIADSAGSKGFPHGIVAFADFSSPDVEVILEAHRGYLNVRGIRQMLHESKITSDLSDNERHALFCGNAELIYRI